MVLTGTSNTQQLVAVLDFGAQYAQLIARRVRELGVYAEVVPGTIPAAELESIAPSAIILSGGPGSVYETDAPLCDPKTLDLGVPVLGICYGHQLMATALGGVVAKTDNREYGRTDLSITDVRESSLLFGLPPHFPVWMSHSDSVVDPPRGFRKTGTTPGSAVAAMEDEDERFWSVQFHPEVSHTEHGKEIIGRFLSRCAGLTSNWRPEKIIDQLVAQLRADIGPSRAVCALSGGVDSAVAAALVKHAVGDQLTCIFVDHGLLRQGEAEQVIDAVHELGVDVRSVDASHRFLEALHGTSDPENKRSIIGRTFIETFEDACDSLGSVDYLVQGTIYSDWVESGGDGSAATIKSHHNVGGLPDRMNFKLVEPLRHLFKDEVRQIGSLLGLPDELVWRQPFPGPGLAVRILGCVTPDKLELLRRADAIVRQEIDATDLDVPVWQAFAVLPNLQTVGVQGDGRTYGESIVVRAVCSDDAMTADWARIPHEVLDRISRRIVNEVHEVNRVLFDVTSKPPATIEWE